MTRLPTEEETNCDAPLNPGPIYGLLAVLLSGAITIFILVEIVRLM